jgi:hypothetical protein
VAGELRGPHSGASLLSVWVGRSRNFEAAGNTVTGQVSQSRLVRLSGSGLR